MNEKKTNQDYINSLYIFIKEQTMQIIDTHAHYDDDAYQEDGAELLGELQAGGVTHIVNCASDYGSIARTLKLTEEFPHVYAALGIHPQNGFDYSDEVEAELKHLLRRDKVVAVGEIGLDYYWAENPPRAVQKEILLRQLGVARELDKPVILHVREAYGDMMDVLRANSDLKAVLHSFSGSPEIGREAVELGFYLGIGGVATFKNAKKLPEVIKETPLERLLTETDAPYLTPAPFRGRRNRSDHISFVIEKIAEFKGLSTAKTSEALYQNALRFFSFPS